MGTRSLNPVPFIYGLWKDPSVVRARAAQGQTATVAERTAGGFARFWS